MLAGAGGIDAVLLVVAANESVMPQTREHFEICRLLGIERGVIALTKSDHRRRRRRWRAPSAGRARARRRVVSGRRADRAGVGADGCRDWTRCAPRWSALAGRAPRQHRAGVVRLPIDRVFTVKGFGAVVTGTLVSGAIAVGDTLTVLPRGDAVRVRGLQVHGAAAPTGVGAATRGRESGRRGRRALASRHDARHAGHAGRDARAPTSGFAVARRRAAAARTARACASTTARPRRSRACRSPRRARGRARRGVGAAAGDARVEVPAGGEAFARLRFEQPAVLTRGDRFVLRAASPVVTIGGARRARSGTGVGGVRRRRGARVSSQLDERRRDRMVVVCCWPRPGRTASMAG